MKRKTVVIAWGSVTENSKGAYDVTINPDGSVMIEQNDWGGGTTFEWSRSRARQVAKAILAATERPRRRRMP